MSARGTVELRIWCSAAADEAQVNPAVALVPAPLAGAAGGALKALRPCLLDQPSKLHTDNTFLQWLHPKLQRSCSHHQARWLNLLAEYHYSAALIPGSTDQADFLSRKSSLDGQGPVNDAVLVCIRETSTVLVHIPPEACNIELNTNWQGIFLRKLAGEESNVSDKYVSFLQLLFFF